LEDKESKEHTKVRLSEVISIDEVDKMGLTIAEQYKAEANTSFLLAIIHSKFGKIDPKVEAAIRLVTDDHILLKIHNIAIASKTVKEFSNQFSKLMQKSRQSKPLEDSGLAAH
jgi:hypothetical protein